MEEANERPKLCCRTQLLRQAKAFQQKHRSIFRPEIDLLKFFSQMFPKGGYYCTITEEVDQIFGMVGTKRAVRVLLYINFC